MILLELFGGSSQVEQLDPENYEGFSELDLENAVACYFLPFNGDDYIFHFDKQPYTNLEVDFSYGKVILANGKKKLDYNLTSQGTPVPVLNAMATAMLLFIEQYDPVTIHFFGYTDRQTRFYKKFVRYFGKKLPRPFFFTEIGSDFYATRDEQYENYRVN